MTAALPSDRAVPATGKRLGPVAFAGIVVTYLALITAVSKVGTSGLDDGALDELDSVKELLLSLTLPIGCSVLFVSGVAAWLGWWPAVLVERRRVQRWVWAVPVIFVLCGLAAIDYGALADQGAAFTVILLLTTLAVGLAEETLFRGISVTMLRQHGLRESQVALWSSVIFGAAHLVNALSTGGAAIGQAFAVSFAGYFFYLARRVSGLLLVPVLVHGLFDFSIESSTTTNITYAGSGAAIVAYILVAVVLLTRRHRIEPTAAQ